SSRWGRRLPRPSVQGCSSGISASTGDMNASAYTLIGLTGMVAVLASVLTFAVLRFATAAREFSKESRPSGDNALMAQALEESVRRLKALERATAARAEASERLSSEIISSLTAGLVVVGLDGQVQIINPAGRRLLGLSDSAPTGDYREMI